jgi:hypothetical protein
MRLSLEAATSSMSPLDSRPMREVLRLGLAEGLLEADSPIPSTDGVHRIAVADVPGVATLNVGVGEQTGSRWLVFEHNAFDGPDVVGTMVQVFAREAYVQVAVDVTGTLEESRVQLIQSPATAESPGERLRLYVEWFDARTEEQLGKLSLTGESFDDLLRNHRDATLRWVVQPLLTRRLHRGVLTPASEAAWQVLGDTATPPRELVDEVSALVRQLDDESFSKRQAAQRRLREGGAKTAIVLRRIDRTGLSEEQRQALETLVAAYSGLDERTVAGLRQDPLFLLGVLYSPERPLWPFAARRLEALGAPALRIDEATSAEAVWRHADESLARLVLDHLPRTLTTRPSGP